MCSKAIRNLQIVRIKSSLNSSQTPLQCGKMLYLPGQALIIGPFYSTNDDDVPRRQLTAEIISFGGNIKKSLSMQVMSF